MAKVPDFQKTLFEQIRERLPTDASFVHEIAELLSISYDSAYRRIRGEKALDIQDLYILADSYSLSMIHSSNVMEIRSYLIILPLNRINLA